MQASRSDLSAQALELAGARAPAVAGGCSGQEMLTPLVRGFCVGGSLEGGGSWGALGWAPLEVLAYEEETYRRGCYMLVHNLRVCLAFCYIRCEEEKSSKIECAEEFPLQLENGSCCRS